MRAKDLFERIDSERCKNLSGYEYDICMWVYNEVKPPWDLSDMKQVAKKYGNVPAGTVHRGAKIDNEETYEKYKNLEPGDTISFDLVSATPDWPDALSFAQYVKSYDESTMLYMLKRAYEQGSAGRYGAVVLSLNTKPENVVVKTYKDGGETDYNKNWDVPGSGAEAEVLLTGDVEIEDIEIIDPITPDNYLSVLDKWIKNAERLSNEFFQRWLEDNLRSNKIDKEEFKDWARNKITKLVKGGESPYDIIVKNNLIPDEILLDHGLIENWLEERLVITKDGFYVEHKGEKIRVPLKFLEPILQHIDLSDVYKNVLDSLPKPKFNVPGSEDRFWWMVGISFRKEYYTENEKKLATLHQIKMIQPEAAKQYANHSFWKEINGVIKQTLSMLDFDFENESEEKLKKKIRLIPEVVRGIERFLDFHPKSEEVARSIFKRIYEYMPRGSYDVDTIKEYSQALQTSLQRLSRYI